METQTIESAKIGFGPAIGFNIDPDIGKLFDVVIPHLGHDISSAMLDLIDNSDDAGATEVRVDIKQEGAAIVGYIISDNGSGMDEYKLKESFRFATPTLHSLGDLGKYGVGGTAACFTLANTKTTITKTKDSDTVLVAQYDRNSHNDMAIVRAATNS